MRIVLYPVSQDLRYFEEYFRARYPTAVVEILSSEGDRLHMLRYFSQVNSDHFVICVDDIGAQLNLRLLRILLVFPKSTEKYIVDRAGRIERLSLARVVVSVVCLPLEIAFGLLLLGSLCVLCVFLSAFPRSRSVSSRPYDDTHLVAYLRTDPRRFDTTLRASSVVTHTLGFMKGLLDNGYNVIFLSSDSILDNKIVDVPNFLVPYSYVLGDIIEAFLVAYNITFVLAASRILSGRRCSFLYQRYSYFNFSGVILSSLLKVPLVLEFNSSAVWTARITGRTRSLPLMEAIERLNLGKADLIVVVSEVMKRKLIQLGYGSHRILVNPNAVDSGLFGDKANGTAVRKKYNLAERIVVGFVGIFEAWHGVEVLLEAASAITDTTDDIVFLLMGDGILRNRIVNIIERRNLQGYVIMTGLVPLVDLPEYLAACDILVSPHVGFSDGSEFFGSPIKIFEYMAMRKAIVASNLGQIGQVLHHNETALLVPPGDARALAHGILKLSSDRTLREKLGEAARREAVAKYTWEINAKRVLQAVCLARLSEE